MTLIETKESVEEFTKRVRRHIHEFPELSFREFETAKFIEVELRKLGLEPRRLTETGVVADIEMGAPGKMVAVRGDMDALPLQEESGELFASKNPGVMHACGHDGHTSMVMGLAKKLVENRKELKGRVRLIFQPAEETPPGGALKLIQEGVLEGVDYIIGQHIRAELEVGQVGLNYTYANAIMDHFSLSFKGKGGHGARPHQTQDVLLVASEYVVMCQSIISRMIESTKAAVLTFGTFNSGMSPGVIASDAALTGSVRAYDSNVRDLIRDQLKKTQELLCQLYRCTGEFLYEEGYPALMNNKSVVEQVEGAAESIVGKENVIFIDPSMAGEDFSYYAQKVPACFYRLGVGNREKGITVSQHSPKHRLDERALPIGVNILYEAVKNLSRYELKA